MISLVLRAVEIFVWMQLRTSITKQLFGIQTIYTNVRFVISFYRKLKLLAKNTAFMLKFFAQAFDGVLPGIVQIWHNWEKILQDKLSKQIRMRMLST